VIGAFLMGVILIGLNLVGVTTYAQPVLTGLILLGAVAYDRWKVRASTSHDEVEA
jgi:inositol transport system permease protein